MSTSGARGVCPFCRTALAASVSASVAEVRRCPRCEAGLWALALPTGPAFFVRHPGQSDGEFLAGLLGSSAREIDLILRGTDSLDRVEFLDELEAAAGIDGDSPGA